MKISFAAVIAAALTLSGCVTMPKGALIPPIAPVSALEVFTAIACVLRAAVDAEPSLVEWGANVTVVFSTGSHLILKPGAGWTLAAGPATLKVGPSLTTDGQEDNVIQFQRDYKSFRTLAEDCDGSDPKFRSTGLSAGKALLNDLLLAKGLPAHSKTMIKVSDDQNQTFYRKMFTVTHATDGTLTFSLGPVDVTTEGSSASFSGGNTIQVNFVSAINKTPQQVTTTVTKQRTQINETQQLTRVLQTFVSTGG